MRKALYALVLVLALSNSVFAGDIPSPPAPGDISNPSSPIQSSDDQATDDRTATGASAPETDGIIHGDDADSLTAAALTVLNTVLALF